MLEELQRLYRLLQEDEQQALKETLREAAGALRYEGGEFSCLPADA